MVIGMEESALLKSSLLRYLLPLALLMAGAILGGWLAPVHLKDAYSVGGAGHRTGSGFCGFEMD